MGIKLDKNSGEPLYLQIKESIKKSLPSTGNEDKVRIPSERQLAEMYSVSRMTARQALKKLSEELSLQRNEQGTFFNKNPKQPLTSIRFVFPRDWAHLSLSTFYSNVFASAETASHQHGCDLVFSTIDKDLQLLEKIRHGDAVVLVGETNRSNISKLLETGCKLCLVDCNASSVNQGWDHVGVDNAQGSTIAADALINMGHSKIAYIGPTHKPPSFAFKQRHKAFTKRLKEHGITLANKDCLKMEWGDEESVNSKLLDKLLDNNYTAVYGGHSHFTLDLLQLARNRGVDDRISFIGFSDDRLCQQGLLNTIDATESRMGELAIEQIVKSHDNGWCLKQSTLVSTTYIDRGSVHKIS